MSTHSDIQICPECGKKALVTHFSNRPYDSVSGICLHCGFGYKTIEERVDKMELEDMRKDYEYDPKTGKVG